ncbi:MAG: hypothetical protein EZS28_018976 [Streblomastix strix]|uniref:Uncharacterized protein n=1 Tax=Streblomastix strix TaxID=222440 RepID=A0A5J4VSD8_9EUKA|nr:MAG: hypothetical protein EZS28_018976 [Streblomastix strix]
MGGVTKLSIQSNFFFYVRVRVRFPTLPATAVVQFYIQLFSDMFIDIRRNKKRQNLFEIPNEIITDLFLGGYMDEDEMVNIMKELRITHVLNCIKEYAPGLDGKSLEEYKVPKEVIVHHIASVVIGYLLEKYHLTFAKAFEITFHQRSIIQPNAEFVKQLYLKEYEMVDQFGVEDQQLKQLPKKDDNLINAIEIELGKELHPLIRLQDISRLPSQSEFYLTRLSYLHSNAYKPAQQQWEMMKQDKEKEGKKTQDE